MIDFYTFGTPNGRKVSILLEELALPYTTHVINITKGEQHTPEFLAINPNGRIPAIVDQENGLAVFESGAILIYLAEKTGQFLPSETKARFAVMEWLMFQMGGVGPMMGQMNHFRRFAPEKVPYGIERYTKESQRLLAVMNGHLATHAYLAGSDYSIADMATYPWVFGYEFFGKADGLILDPYPHVQRWCALLAQRPGVVRGMAVPAS